MPAQTTHEHHTLDDFLAGRSPMQRARAEAALSRFLRSDGSIMTRAQLVRRDLQAGARVLGGPEGRQLTITGARDVYRRERDLTSTAMDYARHLEARMLAQAPAARAAVIVRAERALQDARAADKAWWVTRDPTTWRPLEARLNREMVRVARLRAWLGKRSPVLS